jgi:ribosomal protein L40E
VDPGSEALWLDGNAVAGVLAEVFAEDVTVQVRTCTSCGARNALGAHRAYRGAGVALRCPSCDHLALRIAFSPERRAT